MQKILNSESLSSTNCLPQLFTEKIMNTPHSFNIAIGGATGNVGQTMLAILQERRFPAAQVVALASAESVRQGRQN